jgi:hypothetical protein
MPNVTEVQGHMPAFPECLEVMIFTPKSGKLKKYIYSYKIGLGFDSYFGSAGL